MKHAKLSDLKEIYRHFQKRKDVFPHVRQDKLHRMIEKAITFGCRRTSAKGDHGVRRTA